MAEFKFFCSCCGHLILGDVGYSGRQINCPACQQPTTVPQVPNSPAKPQPVQAGTLSIAKKQKPWFIAAITAVLLLIVAGAGLILFPKLFSLLRGKPQGLVARWPANGSTKDVAGGQNFALLNGASFSNKSFNLDNTAGINGGQRSNVFPPPAFDGGAYVQVPDSDAWAFGKKDFTIELWANFNALPVYDIGHAQGGVFISSDEGPYEVNKWWFALGGGVLNFHINDPKHGPVFLVQAPFTPKLNQWYHFAITRRRNVFIIYANGEVVGSETNSREIPNSNAPLNIGEAEGYYFNGLLEGIGIYQRALSAKEIKGIFNAGAPQ